MSSLEDTTKNAKAFDNFAQKLKRLASLGSAKEPRKKDSNEMFSRKIAESEAAYKKDIIAIYKKFLSPFEVLGKTSDAAAEINFDRENLMAAYNLYSEMQKVNAQFATRETFFSALEIETPIAKRDRYTLGGEFIYLQCWFLLENRITDYVPILAEKDDGNFQLKFVTRQAFRFAPQDKSRAAVVAACFYPGTKI